jgi:hypothetical protein
MNTVVGKTCPYCQTPIQSGEPVVLCHLCGMPHHTDCWQENGGCTTFGCGGAPAANASQRRATPSYQTAPVYQAAPALQWTHDGRLICPTCRYIMDPFEVTCRRCANLRRQAPPALLQSAPEQYVVQPFQPSVVVFPPAEKEYVDIFSESLPPECPYELRCWNWGAFAITTLWAAAMNQWLWCVLSFIPVLNFFVSFHVAASGNAQAWKTRRWASVEQFRATQGVWNYWGIGIVVLTTIITFVVLYTLWQTTANYEKLLLPNPA